MSLIRVGLDGHNRAMIRAVQQNGAAVLISANNLWRPKQGRFADCSFLKVLEDVALDSGGFVAMLKHGGYRFGIPAYIAFAGSLAPTWYASMDFCCEPEITHSRGVLDRQWRTVIHFGLCWKEAEWRGIKPPMPVIQGYAASDYGRCFDMLHREIDSSRWPDLIGIGSVCRRHLRGPAGVLGVVAYLDAVLPPRFRFHLFGVKGAALGMLAGHPRFGGMDSIAYDAGHRQDFRKAKLSRTNAARAVAMTTWYGKQTAKVATDQPDLFSTIL